MISLRIAVAGLATSLALAPHAAPQSTTATADATTAASHPKHEQLLGSFECLTRSPRQLHEAFAAAVRRGDIPDPADRPVPTVAPSRGGAYQGSAPLTFDDILAWEDTDDQILTAFGPGWSPDLEAALQVILVEAANDVLVSVGDDYDFIAFWMNYPVPLIGNNVAASCAPIQNDVTGLGSFDGTSPDGTFDFHDDYGLAGSKTQGLVLITSFNSPLVGVNLGTIAHVSHIFHHRWGTYLPDLLDGRQLHGQSDALGFSGPCGGTVHWNGQVDGQGSINGISEWIGSNPAVHAQPLFDNLSVNTDIVDGLFNGLYSYLDLYLMGMVSPAEVDAGMSELRYMDDAADCSSDYFGAISEFTVADIVATAGVRDPDSVASQKDFRTAWVFIHQPGDPPDDAEKTKLIGILEQQRIAWEISTLGRSTMSHNLGPGPWADLGNALAGTQGLPQLEGQGVLLDGTETTLTLTNALPFGSAYMVLGVSNLSGPFKQGVLVPSPDVIIPGLPLDATGSLQIGFAWPAGLPSGAVLYWQDWIPDPAGVANFAASNAVSSTIP